jgi:hypothetical protein
MTNVLEVVAKVRAAGGTIGSDGAELLVRSPAGLLSASDLALLREHKSDLVRVLAPVDAEREAIQWLDKLPQAEADKVVEQGLRQWRELVSWDWFDHISDEDRDHLLGPRSWPEPCLWCGARLSHGPACEIIRQEIELPLGKFKGKRLDQVPKGYLGWLKDKRDLDPDLRQAIAKTLAGASID